MDANRFTRVTRLLPVLPSRRDLLRGLAGAGLGLTAVDGWPLGESEVEAKKRRKKKKKKKKTLLPPPVPPAPPVPPPFNQFGCLDIGQPCQGDSTLCCSGICDPKSSTCVAHNSDICFADTDVCTSNTPLGGCNADTPGCACHLTTGNAGFCADFRGLSLPTDICRLCSTDTDCQEEFGPGAACIVVAGRCTQACVATGRTACAPPCV